MKEQEYKKMFHELMQLGLGHINPKHLHDILKKYIKVEQMEKPKVQLTGADGNAFMIIGRVNKEIARWNMKHSDNPKKLIDKDEFEKEATSGDYDHLLQTVMKYCDVS